MGAHALGAAAYAARAAGVTARDRPEAVGEEIRWQLGDMSTAVRSDLRQLPPVGENASVPSAGAARVASRTIIRDFQTSLADSDDALAAAGTVDSERGGEECYPSRSDT